MTEVLFYHLEQATLEAVLPSLLEKSLARGWRAVVQVGSQERLKALDAHLWTYRDEGFLPHGTADDGRAGEQPVWLTDTDDNPNGAAIRFLADGASPTAVGDYERVVLLFDGTDPEALTRARAAWKTLKDTDHAITYWQQTPEGRWEKKAEG